MMASLACPASTFQKVLIMANAFMARDDPPETMVLQQFGFREAFFATMM